MAAIEKARSATEAQLESAQTLPVAYFRQVFPQPGQPLPSGWRWVRLGEVCETTSGGTPNRGFVEYFTGNIPWVKSGELPDGQIRETEEHITEKAIDESNAKVLPVGTLLMAMYGATVGKLGILSVPAATNQAVCAIKPNSKVDRDYLFRWLLNIRTALLEASFGGAQPNISQSLICQIKIPLPSLTEQKRIAAMLAEKFSSAEKIINQLQEQLETINKMPAALLRKAFNGEL